MQPHQARRAISRTARAPATAGSRAIADPTTLNDLTVQGSSPRSLMQPLRSLAFLPRRIARSREDPERCIASGFVI